MCGEEKSLDNYYSRIVKGKLRFPWTWCKKCHIIRSYNFRQTPMGKMTEMKKDAKKRGIPFSLTIEDIEKIWGNHCHYCGRKINLLSLDRIDNSKPYEIGNIVPCCKWCNYTKGTGSISFFYDQCKKVSENLPKNLRSTGSIEDSGSRYNNFTL